MHKLKTDVCVPMLCSLSMCLGGGEECEIHRGRSVNEVKGSH